MKLFYKLWRDPLTHFLLVGLLFFLVDGRLLTPSSEESPGRIVVTEGALLQHLQYRSRAFNSQGATQSLQQLTNQERESLIDDYVREEALYREAQALALDKVDYSSRRRMVQRLEYITRAALGQAGSITDAGLKQYYETHKERYRQPAEITFAHVFFNRQQRSEAEVLAQATEARERLNRESVPFHQAMAHGDRFYYHVNYVRKNAEEVASHFGESMQQQLFALAAIADSPTQGWQGPFQSAYGSHVVFISQYTPAYQPALEEVSDRVRLDAQQADVQSRLQQVLDDIVNRYEVQLVFDVEDSASTETKDSGPAKS